MKIDANDILRNHGADALRDAFNAAQSKAMAAAEAEGNGAGKPKPDGSDNDNSIRFTPTLFAPGDASKFPRRQFLYGRQYARQYVSTTIATGDVGKTTLCLAECVAMASGMPLLGVHFKGPLRVWYWNGEDPCEEIDRRLLAIYKHYRIGPEATRDRLFRDSGREMKLIVAEAVGRSFKIAVPVQDALTKALIDNKIDILAIDPFVKTHRVSENDNALMDAVVTVFPRSPTPQIAESNWSSTRARPAATKRPLTTRAAQAQSSPPLVWPVSPTG